MKNTLSFLLYVFISILCICAFSSLPMNDNSQIREKYSSWSGVIRIWISDSTNASPAPWVNACSKDFEKLQNGVYINVQTVPASAIADMATDNPPDMIIWPSGLLDSPADLAEITGEYPLRENLARSPYAVPLLTDAHAWIHSLPSLPSDMENTPAACRERDLISMTALSTGLRPGETSEISLPGVDIGLSLNAQPTPSPEGTISCRASKFLSITDDPIALLESGEAQAITGNMSDVRALCENGSFRAQVTGEYAYTGEITYISIISKSSPEKQSLCEDFIAHLLGPGQEKAGIARAMPAAENARAYSGDPLFSSIEDSIDGLPCICPPVFKKSAVPESVYMYISGRISADEAVSHMDE